MKKTSRKIILFVLFCSINSFCFSQIKQEFLKYLYGDIALFKVTYNGEFYGNSVWINRSKNQNACAKYFAAKQNDVSVYNRFLGWSGNKHIIMYFSGTFTNDYKSPTGITIDNGTLINRELEPKMDGLVIVYCTGGIAVSNLEEGNLTLPDYKLCLNLRNEGDKNTFINFARKESATVFQTQLLIYKNVLKCKPKDELRERRFLLLVKDSNGDVIHVMFDIPKGVRLYDMSKSILEFFNCTGKTVIAMLNLDTGNYNMLKIFNADRTELSGVYGSQNNKISDAVNLLVYYIY